MKTLKTALLIVTLSLFAFQTMAGKDEFKKTISKSFDINSDATLKIKNKFGKIHCMNWDENRIKIEVEISVEASSQEKADKYFKKIEIKFDGSPSLVSAETHMEDNIFKNNSGEMSIDYIIHMPESISIDLNNKFGDILLESVKGKSMINVAYGSINAKKLLADNNEIKMSFSEGFIGYIKDAELKIKYSELDLDEAISLSVESKFSEFNLGSVDVLTMESGYDEDYIGKVRNLDIEADFSEIEIRSMAERLVADIDYGELKVKTIDKNFKLIEVENSFSDVSLGFDTEASFRVVATVKMGSFSYPNDRAHLNEVELSYTSSKYEGLIGDNKDTNSKVLIETRNAGVTVYFR